MKTVYLLSVISLILLLPASKMHASGCNIPEYNLPPAGTAAEVTPGTSNNMRIEPHPEAELIAVIAPGEAFLVGVGLETDRDYVWIEITYHTAIGWTVAANCHTGEVYVIQSSQSEDTSSGSVVEWGESSEEELYVEREGSYITAPIQMTLWSSYADGEITARYETADDRRDPNSGWGNPATLMLSSSTFTVQIYPAAMFELYWPNTISTLQGGLETRTAFTSDTVLHSEAAVTELHERGQYMEFAWGHGYRSIEYITNGQYAPPPNDYKYRFYGLTYDNRYYVVVSAQVLISPPQAVYDEFRDESWRDSESDLERANYYADTYRAWLVMEDYIATAPEDLFSPNLTSLNDWLATFQIPTDVLPETAFNTPLEYTRFPDNSQPQPTPTALPNLCGAAYGSSLVVGDNGWQILEHDPVRVRIEPAGEYAGFDIPPYEVVAVIAGPVCAEVDGQPGVWWQIQTVDGRTGWVVEGLGDRIFFRHNW